MPSPENRDSVQKEEVKKSRGKSRIPIYYFFHMQRMNLIEINDTTDEFNGIQRKFNEIHGIQ